MMIFLRRIVISLMIDFISFLFWSVPLHSLDCNTPETLGYDRASFVKCESLLATHGICEDGKHVEIAVSVLSGYQNVPGELEYDATLTTECTTMPMRIGRNVVHKMLNIREISKSESLTLQNPSRPIYPEQSCSWNWFSTSVVNVNIEVRMKKGLMAVISPFQNLIKVEDEVCLEQKIPNQPKIISHCGPKTWTSNSDRVDITSKVIRTKNLKVCSRQGKFVEYETGIVLGREQYCLITINSEIFLLTSDHLLIKPNRAWNITSLIECIDKKIEVLDESNFRDQKLEEESYLQTEGELICRTLLSCKESCDDTNLMESLNSYESGKPGRFFKLDKSQDKYTIQSCYHNLDSERNHSLSQLHLRDEVTKHVMDVLLKKSEQSYKDTILSDGNFSVIPTIITENSHVSVIIICIVVITIIFLICKMKSIRCPDLRKERNHFSSKSDQEFVEFGNTLRHHNKNSHPLKGII